MNEHAEDEKHLYSIVRGFWAALLLFFHQFGKWPTIFEIFTANQDQVRIE
jgi:hypothetical protein